MELRSDDAQGGIGRNSYRITVRQLESMIRLSEAIAKANCVEEITPNMVIEAFNLLRQSIISVEKDDVEVDDDEDEVLGNGIDGHSRSHNDGNSPLADDADADDDEDRDNGPEGGSGANGSTNGVVPKPKTKITYDKYISVVNLLVQRVNESEMGTDEETPEGVEGEKLIEWYLEQKEDELNGEEDYHSEKELCRKIIKRMAKVSFSIYSFDKSELIRDSGKHTYAPSWPRSAGRRRREQCCGNGRSDLGFAS